ncbi:MAG: phosphoglucosamine mutase [Bacteroidales bacterium]|nr:phosphoglucosamine mutase [Bacteroidales bacterium]
MTLIKSISGIRGTIGGKPGDALTPTDLVRFVSAYAAWVQANNKGKKIRIVVGRDARVSGQMVRNIVTGVLLGMGADVVDINLASTPTTEIAVAAEQAQGGIIITASHNPKQWNALKLLDSNGEFLTAEQGAEVLAIADNEDYQAVDVDNIGQLILRDYTDYHIEKVLALDLVDADAIREAEFTVALDAINSVGGIIIPRLLRRLGIRIICGINLEPNGNFAHNPEPLPQNLTEISELVKTRNADIGIVVDPDVDRLAFISEDGTMFGEEYTIVSIADYVLSSTPGSTVSNLSSSRALRDITERHGGTYTPAAVGEVNVVAMMKQTNAVIGGEGNGGVIYPKCHYGRDALVGIALMLTQMAKTKFTPTDLRSTYPDYVISKNRIDLRPGIDVDAILAKVKAAHADDKIDDRDGVKIDFPQSWVHLRKSNTEPIIRIYAEAHTQAEADQLAALIRKEIEALI